MTRGWTRGRSCGSRQRHRRRDLACRFHPDKIVPRIKPGIPEPRLGLGSRRRLQNGRWHSRPPDGPAQTQERTQNRTHQGTGCGITSHASPVRIMKPGHSQTPSPRQNQPRHQREAQPWKHLLRQPAQLDHPWLRQARSGPTRQGPTIPRSSWPWPWPLPIRVLRMHPHRPRLTLNQGLRANVERAISDRNRGENSSVHLQHSHDIPAAAEDSSRLSNQTWDEVHRRRGHVYCASVQTVVHQREASAKGIW